jgi:hypothetical protein
MTKTPETLLTEAYEIADGKTMKIGTTAHIKALVTELRAVKDLVEAAKNLKNVLPLIKVPADSTKAWETGVIVGSFLKALDEAKGGNP